nr:hypothetical protein [Veillonella sp. VA141]
MRPFSPWQNGKVERSHKVDGERFYTRKFRSLNALLRLINDMQVDIIT